MTSSPAARPLKVLVALTDSTASKFSTALVARLQRLDNVSLRIIARAPFPTSPFITIPSSLEPVWHTYNGESDRSGCQHDDYVDTQVAEYCSWADLLVLAPLDAENIAQMLHGFTSNLHLKILRSWDVSKKILLIPGMSTLQWEHPM